VPSARTEKVLAPRLVGGADHDAGSVCDECPGRGESKAAAAAGHEKTLSRNPRSMPPLCPDGRGQRAAGVVCPGFGGVAQLDSDAAVLKEDGVGRRGYPPEFRGAYWMWSRPDAKSPRLRSEGAPIIYNHPLPGARNFNLEELSLGAAAGRSFTLERPRIGLSTRAPARSSLIGPVT
jgi:hypothetical protein